MKTIPIQVRNFVIEGVACQPPSSLRRLQATPLLQTSLYTRTAVLALYYVSKETGWVGSEKQQFLLTYTTIYADVEWVDRSEKFKKCVEVI